MLILALLVLTAMAPRQPLEVCTGECCAAAAADGHACECCGHCGGDTATLSPATQEHAPEATLAVAGDIGEQPDRNRSRPCGDCLVNVSLAVQLGPLPQAIDHQAGNPACTGVATSQLPPSSREGTDGAWPFVTGPPRPDPKTSLIATTILRR